MKGFIIDAPQAVLIGKDNSYHCMTARSGSVNVTGSSLNIKAGWSLFDLANISTGSEIAIELVDARLDSDILPLALGAKHTTNTATDECKFGVEYTVGENATIVIPEAAKEGSVKFAGLEEVSQESEIAEGKFYVTITEATSGASGKTTITFHTDMKNKVVKPVYYVSVTGGETFSVKNDGLPQTGMMVLKFPVYGDDEEDSSIIAMAQISIYRASVTQNFNMGGSYKAASEFTLSAKGLDARRADKKIFDVDFIPYKG